MKKIVLAAPFLFLGTAAFAADAVYVEPAPIAPVASSDWSGFYAGVQLGGAFGNDGQIELSPFTFPGLITAFTPAGAPAGSSFSGDGEFDGGFIGGVHVGYDWQVDRFVFGGILDISGTDIGDEQRAFSRSPAAYVISRELDYLVTLRARLGYTFSDRYLAYVTGGAAYGEVDFSYRQGALSPATTVTTFGDQDSDFGYTVGGGIEARVTERISLGLEYLYTNLGDNDFTANLQGGPFGGAGGAVGSSPTGTNLTGTDGDFDFHTVQVKLSYHF